MDKNRLAFADNIRIALIVLVIAHHVGQAYGPTGGWWAYQESVRAPWLGAFFTVNRSFFMSLFFFISGYFMPGSLDRKGAKRFLGDRMRRFGWPLVFFLMLVIPILHYFYFLNFRYYGDISFPAYYAGYYLGFGAKPADWSGPSWPEMNFGHLWFIEHLLLFSCCYVLWRSIRKPKSEEVGPIPGTFKIIAFSLLIAVISLVVRIWYPIDRWTGFLKLIQVAFADFPRDLGWFVAGVWAYRKNWLLRFPVRAGYAWLSAGTVLAALYYLLSLLNIFPYTLYLLWETFLCTGLCIGIPVLFREMMNRQETISRELAAATYGVYLFHVPVLVPMQYAFGYADLGPSIKFLSITVLASVATFMLIVILRRFPFMRTIL